MKGVELRQWGDRKEGNIVEIKKPVNDDRL